MPGALELSPSPHRTRAAHPAEGPCHAKAPHASCLLPGVLVEATPAQLRRAALLLLHEGAKGGAEEAAIAAGRVYDKLEAHLAPLLGQAGVRALFVRSVDLSRLAFPFLEASVVESSTPLRACLRRKDAAVAEASAAALFGTFFTLLSTFLGDRLTTQALRRAWPTLDEMAPSAETRT